jgi:uncharacterized protein YodC (DUF2158 family)
MPFAIGDVVQLKSGGPQMTVKYVEDPSPAGSTAVHCVWFDGTKLCSEMFHPATLKSFVPTHQRFATSDYDPFESA